MRSRPPFFVSASWQAKQCSEKKAWTRSGEVGGVGRARRPQHDRQGDDGREHEHPGAFGSGHGIGPFVPAGDPLPLGVRALPFVLCRDVAVGSGRRAHRFRERPGEVERLDIDLGGHDQLETGHRAGPGDPERGGLDEFHRLAAEEGGVEFQVGVEVHGQEIGLIGPEELQAFGRLVEDDGAADIDRDPADACREELGLDLGLVGRVCLLPGLGFARPTAAREPRGDAVGAESGDEDDRQPAAVRLGPLADVRGQPKLIGTGDDLEPALDLQEDAAGEVNLALVRLATQLVAVEPALKGRGSEVELMAFRECQPPLFLRKWGDRWWRLGPGLAPDQPRARGGSPRTPPGSSRRRGPLYPGLESSRTGRVGPWR